jgi:hypothetical protein
METTDKKELKTIDLTPTWSQWLNLVMSIALRGKDPAKVLEPLSRDFKKMAVAADLWNNIPEDTDDVIQEAIDLIKYQSEGQTGPDGEPVYPELVGKLEAIQLVFISAQVAIDAVK